MLRRIWHPLVAVLLGNFFYLALENYLPAGARHTPFRLDWGLAVDFWLCLVCYGLLSLAKRFRRRGQAR
jgi:hypothetical protein